MMSSTTQKPPFLRDGWFLVVQGILSTAKLPELKNNLTTGKITYTSLQLSSHKAVSIKPAQ